VREFSSLNDFKREAGLRPPGAGQAFWHENQLFCDAQHSGSEHSKLKTITGGTLPWSSSPSDRGVFLRSWGWLPMAGIARSIELGATEPVLIASEALKDLELNGQVDNDEPHQLASLVGTAEFVAH